MSPLAVAEEGGPKRSLRLTADATARAHGDAHAHANINVDGADNTHADADATEDVSRDATANCLLICLRRWRSRKLLCVALPSTKPQRKMYKNRARPLHGESVSGC